MTITLVVSIMNKHKIYDAVAQCIIGNFWTNENIEGIEIWQRFNVQLKNGALSSS